MRGYVLLKLGTQQVEWNKVVGMGPIKTLHSGDGKVLQRGSKYPWITVGQDALGKFLYLWAGKGICIKEPEKIRDILKRLDPHIHKRYFPASYKIHDNHYIIEKPLYYHSLRGGHASLSTDLFSLLTTIQTALNLNALIDRIHTNRIVPEREVKPWIYELGPIHASVWNTLLPRFLGAVTGVGIGVLASQFVPWQDLPTSFALSTTALGMYSALSAFYSPPITREIDYVYEGLFIPFLDETLYRVGLMGKLGIDMETQALVSTIRQNRTNTIWELIEDSIFYGALGIASAQTYLNHGFFSAVALNSLIHFIRLSSMRYFAYKKNC
ncbi:MAG: hypothetical protein GXN92_00205 [Candidatus Micrarchaeota archaeon]|nr:hypothetical protein [Candidatus Micrarchaeota archaeon]